MQTTERFLCSVIRGDEVDWPAAANGAFYKQFLDRAIANGVDLLVCHLLRETQSWENIPEATREELEQRTRDAIAVDLARTSDLVALNEALAREKLQVLLLKGAALARTHYPQPYLRARVDTDLMIELARIRQIRALLAGLDYDLVGWTYKSHQFNATKEKYGGRVIRYDVHWRANNGSKYARVIGFEDALAESVPVPGIDGARTLGPVHSLMLACMHRAGTLSTQRDRLVWLYDMHLLVSAMSAEELSTFATRAQAASVQQECHAALMECSHCFGTNLSPDLMSSLATAAGKASRTSRFARSQLALILDDVWKLPDWSSRLEMLREFLFPPGEYLLLRYGKEGWHWVPVLYCRYLFGGVYERFSLR